MLFANLLVVASCLNSNALRNSNIINRLKQIFIFIHTKLFVFIVRPCVRFKCENFQKKTIYVLKFDQRSHTFTINYSHEYLVPVFGLSLNYRLLIADHLFVFIFCFVLIQTVLLQIGLQNKLMYSFVRFMFSYDHTDY